MKERTFVSETITDDIIETLEKGNNYLIASEMGSGKNYWMRNVLLPFALDNNKKTLCLAHRRNTVDQQINYLEEYKWECIKQFKGGMFELTTYQTFQNMIKRNDLELSTFDYIICDEAHYFVSDSSFNTRTELAFDFLNDNTEAIKIYMTGTSDGLFYLPWNEPLETLREADYFYNSAKDLYRYETDETIAAIMQNEIEKGKKVLAFHESKDTLTDFNYGTTEILFSGNRKNSLAYNQIVADQKFEADLLNATKLISEATEIKDDDIDMITLHGIKDIDTFVQSASRVRGKKVDINYKRVTKRSIAQKLNYLDKQLFYYEEFIRLGETEFIKEYGIDVIGKSMKAFYLTTIIDPVSSQEYTRLKVHKTGLAYLQYQEDMYLFMQENGFEAFFDTYFPEVQYIDLEQLKRENFIQLDIIENYVDKKIFKEQQEELKEVICNKYGLRAKNGSTKVGMKTINSFFEENNINYEIESKREESRQSENYKKRYWILKLI